MQQASSVRGLRLLVTHHCTQRQLGNLVLYLTQDDALSFLSSSLSSRSAAAKKITIIFKTANTASNKP